MIAAEKKLKGIAERFVAFHKEFAAFFQTQTRDNSEVAGKYLSGLVQSQKKNMERMEEKVPESNEQALQHFVTNSPWDEGAVLDQVATEGNKLLGGQEDSCLLIDESGFAKKGKKSVGVSRQYCGRTGKLDNCQVAVFAALVAGDKSLPIDFRLYLAKEWTDDPERCLAAGIPQDKIEFKTKNQLALDLVKAAKDRGVQFNWVGADAAYGKDSQFLNGLQNLGLTYVVDAHKSQIIYFANPAENEKTPGQSIEKWALEQAESAWKAITVRESTKGKLIFNFLHTKVWIRATSDGNREKEFRQVRLIIRGNQDNNEDLKYSFSNAPDSISLERLAYMQGQRFWIERAFEDGKSTIGMADYQLRKWRGWHHHMSLVLLAHLFLLRERIHNAESFPLLSFQDMVTMLSFYLPKRDVTEEEIFRQLAVRHRKREKGNS